MITQRASSRLSEAIRDHYRDQESTIHRKVEPSRVLYLVPSEERVGDGEEKEREQRKESDNGGPHRHALVVFVYKIETLLKAVERFRSGE